MRNIFENPRAPFLGRSPVPGPQTPPGQSFGRFYYNRTPRSNALPIQGTNFSGQSPMPAAYQYGAGISGGAGYETWGTPNNVQNNQGQTNTGYTPYTPTNIFSAGGSATPTPMPESGGGTYTPTQQALLDQAGWSEFKEPSRPESGWNLDQLPGFDPNKPWGGVGMGGAGGLPEGSREDLYNKEAERLGINKRFGYSGGMEQMPQMGGEITGPAPGGGGEKIGAVNPVTGETIPIQPWQQVPGMSDMNGGITPMPFGDGQNLDPRYRPMIPGNEFGGEVVRKPPIYTPPETGGLPVAPPPISGGQKGGGGMYSGEQYAGLDMSGFNPRPQQTADMRAYTLNGKTYHGSSSAAGELQEYLNSTGQGDAFSWGGGNLRTPDPRFQPMIPGNEYARPLRQTTSSPSLTQRKF